jgi:sigma-B regulation protein RsbU (phosphoserine phosphatase)
LDEDNLSIFVLDVSGHGIKSALLSVSLSNALNNRAVSEADFYNPGDLLTKLNQSFQSDAEINVFFTIWYGVLNIKSGKLTYASGGAPPALLIRPSEDKKQEPEIVTLNTQDVLMGADDNHMYQTGEFQMNPRDYLYVFSDGIFEISRPNGRMLGLQEFTRLLPLLSDSAQENLDEVVNQVRALSMSDHFEDDISLLALHLTTRKA